MHITHGHLRPWQRLLIGWLCAALAMLPLAGCKTPPREPELTSVHIAAVVLDEQRLARRDEAVALTVLRAGTRLPGRARLTLEKGDRVETGYNVTVVIRWPGLGDVYLRPNSAGTIGSLDDLVGTAFVKVRGFFAVQTRLVGAIAKGTAFLVHGMTDGTLQVTVFESAVEMSSRANRWPPVLLRAGETASAALRAPRPAVASEAEMQSTREWVERVEKLLYSPTTSGGRGVGIVVAVGIAAAIAAILLSRDGKKATPSASAPDVSPNNTPATKLDARPEITQQKAIVRDQSPPSPPKLK